MAQPQPRKGIKTTLHIVTHFGYLTSTYLVHRGGEHLCECEAMVHRVGVRFKAVLVRLRLSWEKL